MDTALIFDIVTTTMILAGLVFAGLEIRHMNKAREHSNMIAILNSFTSTDFNHALPKLFGMPDGLSRKEVEEHFGDEIQKMWVLFSTFESLGVLLHRGEISIDLIDDFFSGPIVLTWQKLSRYIEALRVENNRETIAEWVQWLAEQMMLRETGEAVVGAQILHKDWRPPK